MPQKSNAFSNRRVHGTVVVSILASSAIAIALLGMSGAVASLIFMPVLISLGLQSRGKETLPNAPQMLDARGFIATELANGLGQIGNPTTAMVLEIDDFHKLEEVHDQAELDNVLTFVKSVMDAHLSDLDITVRLDGATFAAALAPQAPFDREVMLQTCSRIQHSLNSAQLFGDVPTRLTASIGFAPSTKLERPTGEALLQAAMTALTEARRKAPGAVRGYSTNMANRRSSQLQIGREATNAFEKDEIFAYFQPQMSLADGSLTGFEALSRWYHPLRGIISPAEFLPALDKAGLMGRLGDTMVKNALHAMRQWDDAGLHVPSIGVNLSTIELRDPLLVDRMAMLLDASGIKPNRLVIEVLETVVANKSDDDVICNLAALSDLGCGIDLDDFGTGYASVTNIRRFSVERIKIDRSFVAGLDSDSEQRSMVAAMLTMADRLGVKTLAEGVETKAELKALQELGCDDAQGFTIARPIPLDETIGWIKRHSNTLEAPIPLDRRAG